MTERRYGRYGNPENPTQCIEEVSESGRYGYFFLHQCSRPRGHGPDGLYCKQHAKMKEKENANRD